MDVPLEAPRRRRAPRHNVQFTRAALSIVRPINRQIGEWQSSVALLDALSSQAIRTVPPEVGQRARTLLQEVQSRREAFLRELETLPPAVTSESRIVDTTKALNTVMAGVQRVLQRVPVDS